jgi:hypothetical protein
VIFIDQIGTSKTIIARDAIPHVNGFSASCASEDISAVITTAAVNCLITFFIFLTHETIDAIT